MDELESLVGKSIFDIDRDIVDALESINIKVAVLEYKYKNCGKRYPVETLNLAPIDYSEVISFDDLINFEKIFVFWHFNNQITDLELFNITDDLDYIKNDYLLITKKIENNQSSNIRQGDTKFLAAKRLNETVEVNNKSVNKREFVFTKKYLQKIFNDIKLY
jgi:hypothetical protein